MNILRNSAANTHKPRSQIEAGRGGEQRRDLTTRMAFAGWLLLLTTVTGTAGYHALGQGLWQWGDCLYMAVITLSTVGFGEVLPNMHEVPLARAWTAALIVFGSGILLYFVSTLTAFIVEVDLAGVLRRNRMQAQIDRLTDHYVVCGCGSTGLYIVRELIDTGRPFVVIELDLARVHHVQHELGQDFLYLLGDATADETLREAGVERAHGVVAALHTDPENLYVTLSARALSPTARIVAKAIETSAKDKMCRAGANSVVLTHLIGGMRMVSEMVRPQVVEFLDSMLQRRDQNLRIEEVVLPPGSLFDDVPLRDAKLRDVADALLLAVQQPGGEYEYNPAPSTVLHTGMRLIVIAPVAGVELLRTR